MAADLATKGELEPINERLRRLIGNEKHVDFARRAEVPKDSLAKYLGGVQPPPPVLIKLANALGITIDYLVGRTDDYKRAVTAFDASEDARAGGAIATSDKLPDGLVMVPQLDVSASAGPGLLTHLDQLRPVGHFGVAETWLRSLGVNPKHAEFLAARGDSMYPTIQDGDLMLLDRGYGQVINGKIYVLVVGGTVIVKRLQVMVSGAMMLISDNPAYQAETVRASDVEGEMVQGRVAWFGRPI